jgi:hypothetical protein
VTFTRYILLLISLERVAYLSEVILVFASHLPSSWNVDTWLARSYGFSRVFALVPISLTLLAPATASGDIYKWIDEQGNTAFSNVRPVNPDTVSRVELVGPEIQPATQSPVAPSQQADTRTEQALQARIEDLEGQLQARPSAQHPAVVAQSSYAGDDYFTLTPVAPESSYNSGYDPGYDPGYYPGYYTSWPVSYSSFAAPVGTVVGQPSVVGPVPKFVGPTPKFVGPTPVFVGPTPMFVGPAPRGSTH